MASQPLRALARRNRLRTIALLSTALLAWTAQDANAQTVNLAGISAGGGESQTLTVTATSDNTGLIPNPTVTYSSPNATGSLSFTPVANASGTATITVTVMDNGGTANGGVNTFSQSFTVTVNPVNQAPTLNPLSNLSINEQVATNPAPQTIGLSGISAGPGDNGQTVNVVATSSNQSVISNANLITTYTSGSSTG